MWKVVRGGLLLNVARPSLVTKNAIVQTSYSCNNTRHRRFIQNLATPSKSKPTERNLYGVEDDPDEVLAQQARTQIAEDTAFAATVSSSHTVSTTSATQAIFVDKAISSTLPSTAARHPPEQTKIDDMRRRSKSESPRGTSQKAQEKQFPQLKLNHRAPNFHALSSHGPLELYEYISTPMETLSANPRTKATDAEGREKRQANWLVFFSHPMDFTPVCTTEIAQMARLQDEFGKRGAKLLGLSIGSVEQHRTWMKDLRKLLESGGLHPGGSTAAGRTNPTGVPTIHAVSGGGDAGVLPLSNTVNVSGGVGALDEEKEMGMEDVVGSGSIRITEKAGAPLPGEGPEKSLLRFPIIADEDGFVSQLYGMLEDPEMVQVDPATGERRSGKNSPPFTPPSALSPENSLCPSFRCAGFLCALLTGQAENLRTVRSLFIIDPQSRIRMMMSYPHTTGRNAAEILRVLDALQRHYYEGVFTQEGWT